MVQIPASNPEEPALREPSRRSLLRGGTLLGASAVAGLPVFAGRASAAAAAAPDPSSHLVLHYQPSQPTGWGAGFTPTVGGHTAARDFTFQGTAYRISLLSFGQRGDSPGPVYEDVPADPAIKFRQTLAKEFGAYYAFRYRHGFPGRGEFSVESNSVFVSSPPGGPGVLYGADLYVVYHPDNRRGDPGIHSSPQWIQVINWPQGPSPVPIVDSELRANPFYISGGLTSINGNQMVTFDDTPQKGVDSKGKTTLSDRFMAEVFLVQDTGTKDAAGKDIVNVFGGIKWGWKVQHL
jgi:hypothetical protein